MVNSNKYDMTEKNLYHLSMKYVFKVCFLSIFIFSGCAALCLLGTTRIDSEVIFIVCYFIGFGILLAAIEFFHRLIVWKKRIKMLNDTMNIDVFSEFAGKSLNNNLIYKDDEWFVAVSTPECIIVNKKNMKKDIDISPRNRAIAITTKMNDGKITKYVIDVRNKFVVDQLLEWVR